MKKIAITNAQKFAANHIKVNADHRFDKKLIVPGYYGCSGEMPIFLQDTKHVYAPGGIKAVALVCKANSSEFIKTYGPHYMLVGKKFKNLSHKQQLATIADELIRNGIDVTFADVDLKTSESKIIERGDMLDTTIGADGEVLTPNEDAKRRVILAGMFGKNTAKKVVKRNINLAVNSASISAAKVSKDAKKASEGYSKKAFKTELKSAKAENKETIKTANENDKKAKKEAKKATKVAAKAVDLDAEAATIDPAAQPA